MRENRTYGLTRGLQGKENSLLCTLLYWHILLLPPRLQGAKKSQRRYIYNIIFIPCHISIVPHFYLGVTTRNDGVFRAIVLRGVGWRRSCQPTPPELYLTDCHLERSERSQISLFLNFYRTTLLLNHFSLTIYKSLSYPPRQI